jgi:hypothetical protein
MTVQRRFQQTALVGEVGEWEFFEITGHPFKSYGDKPLYKFAVKQEDGPSVDNREMYESLEEAMVAAVGAKYTGERGAGGSGVDTAAGWFMRMIGAK